MDKVSNDMINFMLKQLGATSIKRTPAEVNIARFDLGDDFVLAYLYEARKGEGTYLQRVSPYPMLLGKFYNEEDIVAYIKKDVAKFKRAKESRKFDHFMDVISRLTNFDRTVEQLFLNRHVPEAALDELNDEMKSVEATIQQIVEECSLMDDPSIKTVREVENENSGKE